MSNHKPPTTQSKPTDQPNGTPHTPLKPPHPLPIHTHLQQLQSGLAPLLQPPPEPQRREQARHPRRHHQRRQQPAPVPLSSSAAAAVDARQYPPPPSAACRRPRLFMCDDRV